MKKKVPTKMRCNDSVSESESRELSSEHSIADPLEELLRQFHELQVYQLELEIQNEELHSAQLKLEQITDELRQSEEKFRTIANSVPVLVWSVLPDGRIDFMNRGVADYTGLGDSEHETASEFSAVHPEDQELTRQTLQKSLLTGSPYRREHRLRRHDGSYRWHLAQAMPLRNDDGEIVKWYGTSIDIHDLRNTQQRLNALSMEMTQIEERERCRIAADLHDQVAPDLLLSMMKVRSLVDEQNPEVRAAVVAEVEGMLMNSISDIRSLTFQLRPPILQHAGFESALKWLAEEIREKYGLQVTLVKDSDCRRIRPEIGSILFQVVRELLLNIVKHAGSCEAVITLTKRKDLFLVTVEDNGAGFEPLSVHSYSAGSTHFGLFNVKLKMEGLGGSLIITSKPGHGTKVAISLRNSFDPLNPESY